MKVRWIIVVVVLLMLTGCQSKDKITTSEELIFSGDIELSGNAVSIINSLELDKIEYNGEKVYVIGASDLLEALGLRFPENDIYMLANDGFFVSMDIETLADTYFLYSKEDGWCFLSEKHPVNSRVKHIVECIVVAKEGKDMLLSDDMDLVGFNIIEEDTNIYNSFGQLRLKMNEVITITDGTTSFESTEINVMKQYYAAKVSAFTNNKVKNIMFITHDGEIVYDFSDGYLYLNNGRMNYVDESLKHQYINIIGLMINPPVVSVMDQYSDSIHYLENEIPVLTLFLDGFSYAQYQYIVTNANNLFLSNVSNVAKATTVYKPVTNAGFAAMITGESAYINGVFDRSFRELKVPNIFDYCLENNLKSALVEGDIKILDIDTTTYLNIDKNENGYTDEEVYNKGLEISKDGLDYLMVHFHGIDDCGHDFGPYSDFTIDKIIELDAYTEELVNNWPGVVIVVADHGMHNIEAGGNHGSFRYEDMTIPYMIIYGGEYEKK